MKKDGRKKNFVRLSNKRMNNVINEFRKIKNLSNKYYYDYDEEDIEIMLSYIKDELDRLKQRFVIKNG